MPITVPLCNIIGLGYKKINHNYSLKQKNKEMFVFEKIFLEMFPLQCCFHPLNEVAVLGEVIITSYKYIKYIQIAQSYIWKPVKTVQKNLKLLHSGKLQNIKATYRNQLFLYANNELAEKDIRKTNSLQQHQKE